MRAIQIGLNGVGTAVVEQTRMKKRRGDVYES